MKCFVKRMGLPLKRALLVLVVSIVSACGAPAQDDPGGSVGSGDPDATCALVVAAYGPTFSVAAAFLSDVGSVQSLIPEPGGPARWGSLTSTHPATICYLDGPIGKSPPMGPSSQAPEPYSRAIVAVVDGESVLIAAGYPDTLEVPTP